MSADLAILQGTWRVTELEVDGALMDKSALSEATVSVAGNRFTTAGMGAEYSGLLQLNETASPKTLEMYFESGPEAGNTNRGIYEISGSIWRMCLCMTGGLAPLAFHTTPGSGYALETLIRLD